METLEKGNPKAKKRKTQCLQSDNYGFLKALFLMGNLNEKECF